MTPFIKRFSPYDWPIDRDPFTWVKVGAAGRIGGEDFRQFRKSAGERMAELVKLALERWQPGEEMIAVNSMGATEIEGPNRNFDGFRLATLEKYHPTFLTARWYRDHQTDDPRENFGVIKVAAFEPTTGRVPVIVSLNGNKEAADRNSGKIANLELDDLNRGDQIKVSMSCRVPEDVCVGCGNRARSREEYCKAATCRYGGCAENLGRVAEDGLILHVDNPAPTFFDLSRISTNQAGRTAYVYGRVKSASTRPLFPMMSGYSWVPEAIQQLAALEQTLSARKYASVVSVSNQTPAPDSGAAVALLSRPGLLSPRGWEAAFNLELPDLSRVYTKIARSSKALEEMPVMDDTAPFSSESKQWAAKAALVPYSRELRIKSAAAATLFDNRRAATLKDDKLSPEVIEYAAYQLASLHRNREISGVAESIILENLGAFS